jgi:hypothetical protein
VEASCWTVDTPLTSTDSLGEFAVFVSRPFDLNDGPLIRVGLAAGPGRQQALLIAVEHLVCDGLSFDTILDDLFTAYESVSPTSEQYNFVRIMSQVVQAEVVGAEKLADRYSMPGTLLPSVPDPLALTDGPRSYVADRMVRSMRTLPPDRVRDAARRGSVSAVSLCTAAIAAAVQRESAQLPFRALMAMANRALAGPNVIGWFANSVIVEVGETRALDAVGLAAETSIGIVEALPYQEISLHHLIARYEPQDHGRLPRRPVLAVDVWLPDSAKMLGRHRPYLAESLPLAVPSWCSGLTVTVDLDGDEVGLLAVFDESAISVAAVGRLLDHIAEGLETMTEELTCTS